MKCIAFCSIGFEDILINDVKEILKLNCFKQKASVIFEANEKQILEFAYKCQSIEKIGILLQQGNVKEINKEINLKEIDFSIIKETFSVNCSVISEKKYQNNDIALMVSNKIKEITNKKATYKQADSVYNLQIIDENYYFYLNLTLKELSKRDYKVFVNKTSLRGNVAYCTAKISGIKKNNKEIVILDPFCRSGEIIIEISHYLSDKSINYYAKEKIKTNQLDSKINLEDFDNNKENNIKLYAVDSSMPNLKAAEKNSKIAGLNKTINFARIPIEDLDLKFDKIIDKIITQLPAISKEKEKRVLDIYRNFFEVCPKILKDNGDITCIGLNIKLAIKIAKFNGFKVKIKKEVMQGKEVLDLFIFEKNK
jgi:23S rRNA G2445 N2-methylase RlmL